MICRVKTIDKLEKEFEAVKTSGNRKKIKRASDSIRTQCKHFWQSLLLNAGVMGVGLTAANIIGTKIRIQKFGFY